MNKDKLTGVEKSIHAAVETFQKNLCREMAKRLDEGRLIIVMETEVSFTTANVDEFIEEQIQELCGTLKPMEETLGADTAQETADEFADRMRRQLREDLIPNEKTLAALRRGCLAHGMPNHNAYVDNGREYLTFDFGGRGHRAKKVLANGEAPFEPKTILDYMGVEMKNAIVQNSRAKLVERSFRNVKEHIMRLFPTYTGGSPEEKPEALKKALQRGAIPTDAEFVQKVDLLISGYLNYEPYYGSVPADKGKRRIDVYNEHLEHVRHVEPDVLNLMMLRTSKPKKVDREGVYLNIRGKKVWYNCPELHSLWQEKKVYLRYDPDDLSSVRVYREDGSFILTAPRCDLEAAYGATQEEIARQQQLKNKYKRVVQELAATLLPDAPPEEAAALVARMAEENLAGPTAKRDPRTVELVQLDEEPWAMAVGEVNVFRMNQNSGGIDDEYDY